MWNSHSTSGDVGVIAQTITYRSSDDQAIHAYWARPAGLGPWPAVLLVMHAPGWDEFYLECAERLARHGYLVMCPDLYCRHGHGSPDDVAAKVRSLGGVNDETVLEDLASALTFIAASEEYSGRVALVGSCSGGRHSVLAASRLDGIDAVVDLWGGGVVADRNEATPARPVAPVEYLKSLTAPLLGIFGNDDPSPSPAEVDRFQHALAAGGKHHQFHRYDGAGHGFIYYHTPAYRPTQAMDAWSKVFAFLATNLRPS